MSALWFDPADVPPVVLEFGQQTAWTDTYLGRTAGVSIIHRVRDVGDERGGVTMCGQGMPNPSRHIPVELLNRPVCQGCENLYAAVTVDAA